MDHNLQILGLAKKAGLLAIGDDATGMAARKGQTKLIISAEDASERAFKNARIYADSCGAICMVVPYTKFEIGMIIGRGSPAIVAFLDTGLAVAFIKGLAESGHELSEKVWKFLEYSANNREARGKTAAPGGGGPPNGGDPPGIRNESGKRR